MASDIAIPAGEERAELIAALRELEAASMAFNSREKATAFRKAIAAFDALRDRRALPVNASAPVLDRLRSAVQFGQQRKFIAVSIDLADAEQLLKVQA